MSGKEKITPSILIADDDPLVCHIIRIHLERAGLMDLTIVHDGCDAVSYATSNQPELMLLDIAMPEMDGIEVLKKVRATSPDTHVIMLTGQRKVELVTEALAAGAAGYLVKSVDDLAILSDTVNLVLEGYTIIVDQNLLEEAAKKVTESMESFRPPEQDAGNLTKNLTSQEMKVLKLIAGGLTNHEIASSLHISYNTVKSHVSSIYEKLNVSGRTQAAIMALRRGIAIEDRD